ncbi:MAG: molecular chaperone TorD family protein [Candidatus Rokubacteria bacterium]|nr:molecular chaperone TorD family protein [Candidatus Rokubacteria bacterium]
MTPEEVGLALARAGVYRLLGGAFAYPAAASLEELSRLAVAAAAGPLGVPPLGGALLALAKALRESDAAELALEHVLLFDRQVRCPPYEGAYGDVPQLAGKAAQLADVAGFYAAFGLEQARGRPDCEDHIAAELEFMSVLALKEAYLLAEGDGEGVEVTRQGQARFLSDHLGRWAQALADALREATALPYYAAAGDLLAAWVGAEVSRVGASPLRVETRRGHDPLQEENFSCPVAADEAAMEEGPRGG